MIFQPVLQPLLLMLLFVPPALLTAWLALRPHPGSASPRPGSLSLSKGPTPRERMLWALRFVLVLACFTMLLRPAIPGGTTQTLATDTDVVLVVDTTASIVAEDWAEGAQRLDGVRADVQTIVEEYPGARFALITFDATAELRLPLTTDTTALVSSLEILRPEVTGRSQGSSVGIANRMLTETLTAAAESSPERARMVFYFGDGEQTASSAPESFRAAAAFVDAGAVLGYGTDQGGPMKSTTGGFAPSGEYIEYQGERALSVIDEENLQTISGELGVEYQHRSPEAAIALPEAPATTTDHSESGTVGNLIELYWIAALLVVMLLAFELARATMLIVRMRGLAAPSPVVERAQTQGARSITRGGDTA